jgi:filamentous hemagglutinin
MNTDCKQNPTSDACRTAFSAAIDYVALKDAWQYMIGDVLRSGGNMFDYLYNSGGARERFGLHLNTIDSRVDFFDASHQWEQNEGIGARWLDGTSIYTTAITQVPNNGTLINSKMSKEYCNRYIDSI